MLHCILQKINLVISGKSLVEAFIDSSGFANIEPDHKVYISLTTYGLTKYGYLTGKLIKVSVDTVF